jgi:hypothetical protein
MSDRVRLVGEVFGRVGNPFVTCRMISLRARQLMSSNTQWAGPQAITEALRELAVEALEIETPNGGAQGFPSAVQKDQPAGEARGAQIPFPATEAGLEANAR